MDPYYPPSIKRLGIPDLLDWEIGDNKRARLGLGEESSSGFSFDHDFPQSDGQYDGQIQPAQLDWGFSGSSQAFDNCSALPEVWMRDVPAPWMDGVDSLACDWPFPKPPVEMTCFGMVRNFFTLLYHVDSDIPSLQICDSKGQLLDDPRIIEKSGLLSLTARQETYELRSFSRDKATFLQLDSDEEVDFAVLDQTTAQTLSAVAKISGCEVDLFLTGAEFRELRRKFKPGEKKIQFEVSAVFYGPSEATQEVGQILSKSRLYLQDPARCRQGVSTYENPHRLSLGDSPSTNSLGTGAPSSLKDREEEVEEILKNLGHQAELRSDIPMGDMMKTKLNRCVQGISSGLYVLLTDVKSPGIGRKLCCSTRRENTEPTSIVVGEETRQ